MHNVIAEFLPIGESVARACRQFVPVIKLRSPRVSGRENLTNTANFHTQHFEKIQRKKYPHILNQMSIQII